MIPLNTRSVVVMNGRTVSIHYDYFTCTAQRNTGMWAHMYIMSVAGFVLTFETFKTIRPSDYAVRFSKRLMLC